MGWDARPPSLLSVVADERVEELVLLVEEALIAQEDHADGAERGAGGDEEHNHNLVFHRSQGACTGKDLTGHHAGETYDADDHHRIDKGNHGCSDRLLDRFTCGLPACSPEGEEGLNLGTLR